MPGGTILAIVSVIFCLVLIVVSILDDFKEAGARHASQQFFQSLPHQPTV